jgi:hypothetical protein
MHYCGEFGVPDQKTNTKVQNNRRLIYILCPQLSGNYSTFSEITCIFCLLFLQHNLPALLQQAALISLVD